MGNFLPSSDTVGSSGLDNTGALALVLVLASSLLTALKSNQS